LHSHRVVHFDLKPANLLLGDDGRVKIADLGIAVILDEPHSQVPVEGDKVYMAPELLKSRFSLAIDIFSLGLVVVEMAAMWPMPTEGSQWEQLRQADFSGLPLADLPEDLADLVVRMLTPDPTARPTIDDILQHRAVRPTLAARQQPQHEVRADIMRTPAGPERSKTANGPRRTAHGSGMASEWFQVAVVRYVAA